MGKVWSAYEAVIDNCLNKDFVIAILVLAVAQMIAGGLLFGAALLLFIVLAFAGLPGMVLGALVGVLAIAAYSAFFTGLSFHLGLSQLEKNKVDFDAAFRDTLAHLVQGTKLMLLLFVVLALAIGLFFAAVGVSLIPLLASFANPDELSVSSIPAGLGGAFQVMVFLAFLSVFLALALLPYTSILFVLPFAEGTGLRASLARALELGRKNYWDNLKLVGVQTMASSGAFYVFYVAAILVVMLLTALVGLAGLALGFWFAYALVLLGAMVFNLVLGSLFSARFYLYDVHG